MKIRTVIEWREGAEAPTAEIQTAQGHRGQAVDSSLLFWIRARGVTLSPNAVCIGRPSFHMPPVSQRWNSRRLCPAAVCAL
jgi:hypothetical protein